MPDADVPTGLLDYMYTSPTLGTSLVVFGHGMLYNHHSDSNVGWDVPTDAELLLTTSGTIRYYARRDIERSEELLINYGEKYWRLKGVTPW